MVAVTDMDDLENEDETTTTTGEVVDEVPPVPDVPEEEEKATEDDLDDEGKAKKINDFLLELINEGITVADLKALKENASTSGQQQALYTLAGVWSVPVAEATQRMEMVKEEWETLSAADKKLHDTVEGAQILWQRIENRNRAGTVGKGRSSGSAPKLKYLYTEAQLDAMTEAERRQNDKRISYAYANGLVKE